jgi:FtsH-binding integral membrane protein
MDERNTMYYNPDFPMTGSMTGFMHKVYGWMAVGLLTTALSAYSVFAIPALFNLIFRTPGLVMVLFLAQIGLVISLSAFVQRMSNMTANLIFTTYSVLTGISLSSIFFVYTATSIYLAFAIAAATFAAMALYGYYSKDDLTSIGTFARMAVFGILIAMLINFFMRSPAVDYVISLMGVGIFTLLIAYDTQKIKHMGYQLVNHGTLAHKAALLSALTLYLDFINLFIFLLRLVGKQKDK